MGNLYSIEARTGHDFNWIVSTGPLPPEAKTRYERAIIEMRRQCRRLDRERRHGTRGDSSGCLKNIIAQRKALGTSQAGEGSMSATFKIIFALIACSTACSSTAFAENCRAVPFGTERRACAMRAHPGMFQARLERCRQLARERGDTLRTATGAGGMKEFTQDCMRAKQR
jgi:hypothetical protein